ncbi:LamG domain-containing protein [Arcticibacterium luteifluviistationis]|nr:LamG domain-containing protein [Arcticibacterium luteifluviistationis]
MKKNISNLLTVLLLIGFSLPTFAQQGPTLIGAGEYMGLSPKVSSFTKAAVTSTSKGSSKDSLDINPKNAEKPRALSRQLVNNSTAKSIDEAVQSSAVPTINTPNTPILSFDGAIISDNISGGGAPPDPVIAVGPNHVVQMVNSICKVYDKSGTLLTPTFKFSQIAPVAQDKGDPFVIYDQAADRWLLMQFNTNQGTEGLVFAVSQTTDPTGPYHVYNFLTPGVFPDYPKIAVWNNTYLATTHDFGSGVDMGFYAFDRNKMLAGIASPTMVKFSVNDEFGYLAASSEGHKTPDTNSLPTFIGYQADEFGQTDALVIRTLSPDFETPANSILSAKTILPVAAFDPRSPSGRQTIEQLSTTAALDDIADRMMSRIIYRRFDNYESMVMNHIVNVSGVTPTSAATYQVATRWYELTRSSPSDPWAVNQQSTYAPTGINDGANGDNRWMGCAGIDQKGNIALGYSKSSTSTFADLAFAERRISDPLNTLSADQVFHTATGAQTGTGNRWGDYSAMAIDPSDEETMWYTGEYYSTTSSFNWRTRIGNFKVIDPATTPTVHFKTGGLIARQVESVTPATGSPNLPYKDYLVSVTIDQAPSQDVNLTFTKTGTATEGQDYDLIIPSPFVLNAANLSKDFTIRIYDDSGNETNEYVNIIYTMNNNGGDAIAAHYNQKFRLTIIPAIRSIPGSVGSNAIYCTSTNSGTVALSGNLGTVVRWESSTDNFVTINNIANTTATQSYTNVSQTTQYRAVVQNGADVKESLPATIAINPSRLYVAKAATGAYDGLSWNNAFKDLQSALNQGCATATEVWVAKGTYTPAAPNGDRSLSYNIRDNLKVYGGFAGDETLLTDRNYDLIHTTNNTKLSGDLNDDDIVSLTENSYTIVNLNNVSNTSRLDGFTISDANNTVAASIGGGISLQSSSPVIANCNFFNNNANYGGGIGNALGQPTIENCKFFSNKASTYGGAIYNTTSSGIGQTINIVNSIFVNNSTTSNSGSIMFNYGNLTGGATQNVNLTNCSFSNNNSPNYGIYNLTDIVGTEVNVVLKNCAFFNNGGNKTMLNETPGGGSSLISATNCLFQSSVTNYSGNNNVISDISPFISPYDLHLSCFSTALDLGTSVGVPTIDLDKQPRQFGAAVDIGAYELQGGTVSNPSNIVVNPTDICTGGSVLLSANCTKGSTTWYDQLSAGMLLGNGSTILQNPAVNTAYFVSCKNGVCESNRAETSQVLVTTPSPNLNLLNDFTANSVQIANTSITATNKIIDPAKVLYKAGNSVMMNEGFEVENGSAFEAKIGGCENVAIPGLVAYYPFNGNANDESLNSFNGVVNGPTLTADRFGNAGKAYAFDGINDKISGSMDGNLFSEHKTISLWAVLSGPGNYNPRMAGVGPAGFSAQYYGLILEGTASPRRIQFYTYGSVADGYSTSLVQNSTEWHNYVVTFDGSKVKIFIDGILDNETITSGTLTSFTNAVLQIGYSDNNLDWFEGKLDDIRIYNRALSDPEVQALYNLEKP